MAAPPFLKSARLRSGLHQLPDAPAVHLPELRCFLVFPERREKRSSGVRFKTRGKKPLIDGFPGAEVNGHLVNFSALFVKLKPTLPFPLVVVFDLECYNGRHSRPAV